jgi:putative oxidoreductase
MNFMDKLRPLGLLLLRCALALIFIHSGYLKYMHGITATKGYMESLGLPSYVAYVAIGLELGGGILLLMGLLTRPVALLLAGEMVVALWKSDLVHGISAIQDYQFAAICGAACFALVTTGAGGASLDALLFGGRGAKPKR